MSGVEFIESKVLEFSLDNDRNFTISTHKNFKFPCCLGIDEAGRGPVLGPMVYSGAYTEIRHLERISNIGLDDSKKLKEETREELLNILCENDNKLCGYEVEILSPNFISNQMLNVTKTNLNTLSHNAALNIIRKVIDKGINLTEVYVDTVGSPEKYKALILSHFPKLHVVVECKADANFKIVSAASIFAKVIRDKCIRNWKHREAANLTKENCGSGYPSDPATKNYLSKVLNPIFGFPQFVRSSWSTASTIVEKDCVPISWEDEETARSFKFSTTTKRSSMGTAVEKSNKSLLAFYSPSLPEDKRHKYFTTRKLKRVAAFS